MFARLHPLSPFCLKRQELYFLCAIFTSSRLPEPQVSEIDSLLPALRYTAEGILDRVNAAFLKHLEGIGRVNSNRGELSDSIFSCKAITVRGSSPFFLVSLKWGCLIHFIYRSSN